MSLTAHILFNRPTRLPVGELRQNIMEKSFSTFRTDGIRSNAERMEGLRLANVERVFNAVKQGNNTRALISFKTGLSDMTALRCLHTLLDDRRITGGKEGRIHVFAVAEQ
jgi:hypothetical protein